MNALAADSEMLGARPSRLPKLGIYCPGMGTGGPWRYVHSVLGGIDLDEFDVSVFCDIVGEYQPRPEIRVVQMAKDADSRNSSEVAPLPRRRRRLGRLIPGSFRLWAGFARQARKLATKLRAHKLDLFHTQNTGCEESPLAGRLAGIPLVVGTFHVDSTYDLHGVRSGLRHRFLEFASNQCLDAGIAVSDAAGSDWIRRTRISRSRVTTIYNGIDPERFRRQYRRVDARQELGLPDESRFIVGAVGRLDEAKGITHLLEAIARLVPEHPRLILVIAGDGPLRDQLQQQAVRLGIAGHLRLLGFQNNVQLVLDALDAFVLPSLAETFGYALLEAMATELPTIGTRVGGIPEIVVPDQTGLLVEPRDDNALAGAIRTLLQSEHLRRRMGQAGRRRVICHFQERDMVRQTIGLYRQRLSALMLPRAVSGRKP